MSHRRLFQVLVAVFAAAVLTGPAPAFAAKPASTSYAPSLAVSWPLGATTTSTSTSTPYVVSGCGYDSSFGGVTVVVTSPEAISFAGQMPDSSGCISLSNFSTQGAGHYQIDAYQTIHNNSKVVASTSFNL
jgi:hypothetical protein